MSFSEPADPALGPEVADLRPADPKAPPYRRGVAGPVPGNYRCKSAPNPGGSSRATRAVLDRDVGEAASPDFGFRTTLEGGPGPDFLLRAISSGGSVPDFRFLATSDGGSDPDFASGGPPATDPTANSVVFGPRRQECKLSAP